MARRDHITSPLISSSLFLVVVVLLLHASPILSSSESEVLLKFKETLGNNGALSNWDPSSEPCKENNSNWSGVRCDNGVVSGLQLENMGLQGALDLSLLADLPLLRTISFSWNNFDGSMPDLKKLKKMKAIYFSHNKFSGEIPSNAFDGMSSLKKLYLDHNQFSGAIPSIFSEMSRNKFPLVSNIAHYCKQGLVPYSI